MCSFKCSYPIHIDAVNELSAKYLTKKWTGSIKFCSLPVHQIMIGSPLDNACIAEINVCDHLGLSKHPTVHCLHLDPQKYDEPPLNGEPVANNHHRKQLKDALEAATHISGSPIMSNGGRSDLRHFRCKLCNRLHRSKVSAKKDGAPCWEDDFINMDKGGRCHEGRSLSKQTRTLQIKGVWCLV
jgi:hypothetical protein